jgi:hypothetical protein
MTSLFRPFLSTILCCVIACGHAPAWLHVATCDGHAHAKSIVLSEKAGASAHCCHHHHDDEPQSSTQPDTKGDGSNHEHDSGSCLICQSLANALGVTWDLSVSLPVDAVSQPAMLPVDCMFASASLSIAHPRGPPVLV